MRTLMIRDVINTFTALLGGGARAAISTRKTAALGGIYGVGWGNNCRLRLMRRDKATHTRVIQFFHSVGKGCVSAWDDYVCDAEHGATSLRPCGLWLAPWSAPSFESRNLD